MPRNEGTPHQLQDQSAAPSTEASKAPETLPPRTELPFNPVVLLEQYKQLAEAACQKAPRVRRADGRRSGRDQRLALDIAHSYHEAYLQEIQEVPWAGENEFGKALLNYLAVIAGAMTYDEREIELPQTTFPKN